MYLTKSDFLKYQCCPSYLWLWKHKRESVPANAEEALVHRLEQGNEVERYAQKLFAGAAEVKSKGSQARKETEKLVAAGSQTIFQATVLTDDGLLAMADMISFEQDSQSWTLYEVKSTNSIKPDHIHDVAFQRLAFEEAGYRIGKICIIHLNKKYVRKTAINPKDLLLTSDVTDRVGDILTTIRQQARDALEVLARKSEPKGCSCKLKPRSGHCPTFQYFNPDVPEYSVFNIARLGGKKLALLVDSEIYSVHEVPEDIKLTTIQQNQVDVSKSHRPMIDKQAIAELMGELEYPLYFLDYETVSTAIPLYGGCSPFQQIPFQYSLHVLPAPEAELEHYDFLGRDGTTTPVPELLDNLDSQIDPVAGRIIVWSKKFETSRNTDMARMYPQHTAFLEGLNERVFDLMEPFSKQLFVHHEFRGSNSIKSVLPVLVPEFSYKGMDISNGEIAAIRWYEAVTGQVDARQAQKTYDDLLKYCRLDTLAMVKIYEYLAKLVGTG